MHLVRSVPDPIHAWLLWELCPIWFDRVQPFSGWETRWLHWCAVSKLTLSLWGHSPIRRGTICHVSHPIILESQSLIGTLQNHFQMWKTEAEATIIGARNVQVQWTSMWCLHALNRNLILLLKTNVKTVMNKPRNL